MEMITTLLLFRRVRFPCLLVFREKHPQDILQGAHPDKEHDGKRDIDIGRWESDKGERDPDKGEHAPAYVGNDVQLLPNVGDIVVFVGRIFVDPVLPKIDTDGHSGERHSQSHMNICRVLEPFQRLDRYEIGDE